MKIVVTGSLGNISKPLAQKLINAGHDITVVTTDEKKQKEIELLGATPALGSVNDLNFLTTIFQGADIVYAMTPPNMAASNMKEYVAEIGKNYAAAIKASGVKKVVLLSAIGAHLAIGAGPISGLHRTENMLNALDDVTVIALRAGNFYYNYYSNINMIKQRGIIGSNVQAGKNIVLVHPLDVAEAAAKAVLSTETGKQIQYVAGDERSTNDVATVLGEAIGKPDLKWIGFTNEQAYQGMVQAGVPEEAAKNFIEMGNVINSGAQSKLYLKNKPSRLGNIRLEDFAKEFAQAYAAR